MATCKNCGANVGCGCQLIDGLCSYCAGKLKGTKRFFSTLLSFVK